MTGWFPTNPLLQILMIITPKPLIKQVITFHHLSLTCTPSSCNACPPSPNYPCLLCLSHSTDKAQSSREFAILFVTSSCVIRRGRVGDIYEQILFCEVLDAGLLLCIVNVVVGTELLQFIFSLFLGFQRYSRCVLRTNAKYVHPVFADWRRVVRRQWRWVAIFPNPPA